MSDAQYFHFTLGPVQSFVAQARRTRDFWAGSFILSWLSGVAMQEVIHQCGDARDVIEFPKAEENFLDWLSGQKKGDDGPEQGSIPNRFKAKIPAGTAFNPTQVGKAVKTAWVVLAEIVYQQDIASAKDLKHEIKTRDIWERQINNTWEIVWAVSGDETDSSILDRRKSWRTYMPPEEAGVKCMMMDGWQELSGEASPNAKDLEAFWQEIRKQGEHGMLSDLRDKEHLCAIGFVKRRFPRYFKHLSAIPMPSGWQLSGWGIGTSRPSVSYMAAAHWLEKAILQTHAEQSGAVHKALWEFHDAAFRLTKNHGSWDNEIDCIRQAQPHKKWEALDGDVFFLSNLENKNNYRDAPDEVRAQAINKLRKLKAVSGLGEATPFYAVLMMDGDSLGKQMSDPKKQQAISNGLQTFTGKVPVLVKENNGFLVYAGGDDVLAVLPVEDALGCALAIRECYEAIFAEDKKRLGLETSISAAIEFAHIHMPLTKVLRDAHHLLDDVAKEYCGRDALAVRVWKPGGRALEWSMLWEIACEPDLRKGKDGKQRLVVERLSDAFKEVDHAGELSNGFFYKLREYLELLNPPQEDKEGMSPLKFNQGVELMAAEYVSSGLFDSLASDDRPLAHARSVVEPLLKQCYPKYREEDAVDPKVVHVKERGIYKADAAMLVRFLAQKEVA